MAVNPETCPSDLALERLLAGDPERIGAHVLGCARCQARVAAMEAQGAEFRRSLWAPRARSAYARADHRWRNRAMLVALVPAVAAALVVGVVPLLDRPAPAVARVDPPPAKVEARTPGRTMLEPRGSASAPRLRTVRLRGEEVAVGQGSMEGAPESGNGPARPFTLTRTEVDANVSGMVASVLVTQEFENPFTERAEAIYVFPLPDNAAVDQLTLMVGQRVIKGVVKKREDARRDYERAKSEGRRAALLDQERPNVFTQSVANLLPGERVKVVLRYVAPLRYDDGSFEFNFPMVVGPRYIPGQALPGQPQGNGCSPDTDRVLDASRITPPQERTGRDISVRVHLDAGFPIEDLSSVSHRLVVERGSMRTAEVELAAGDRVPNKDFILRWKVAGRELRAMVMATRGQDGGYLALVAQPETPEAHRTPVPKEMVFVIDTSGSMEGPPLAAEKAFIRRAMAAMNPDDTFLLVDFADRASSFHASPLPNTPRNVERALSYLEALPSGGGTNQLQGIRAALGRPADPQRMRTVLFLTDGFIGNEAEILAEVQRTIGSARIYSLGVGSSANHYLLGRLAEVGRGFYQYLRPDEEQAPAIERFVRRIARPMVTDLEIDWGGLQVTEVLPKVLPDLFDNQPLVVLAKYAQPGRGRVVVRGRTSGSARELALDVDLPVQDAESHAIATCWARARIEELERLQYGGEKAEVIRQITSLGLEHQLVTAYTSFIALEETTAADPRSALRTVAEPVEPPELTVATNLRPEAKPVTGKTLEGRFDKELVTVPRMPTSKAKVDDDFDSIFGGASDGVHAKYKKQAYIPLAPGWGSDEDVDSAVVRALASANERLAQKNIEPGNKIAAWRELMLLKTRLEALPRTPKVADQLQRVGPILADLRKDLDSICTKIDLTAKHWDELERPADSARALRDGLAWFPEGTPDHPCRCKVIDQLAQRLEPVVACSPEGRQRHFAVLEAAVLAGKLNAVGPVLRLYAAEPKDASTQAFLRQIRELAEESAMSAYLHATRPPLSGDLFQLNQSDIMETVVSHKAEIKACTDQAKLAHPEASGTIVVSWVIRRDGSVTNVKIEYPEVQKTDLSRCLVAAIRKWRFPPYSGPQMAPIKFPFKF